MLRRPLKKRYNETLFNAQEDEMSSLFGMNKLLQEIANSYSLSTKGNL